jgi:hypothetical protein
MMTGSIEASETKAASRAAFVSLDPLELYEPTA